MTDWLSLEIHWLKVNTLLDWEGFRPIAEELSDNKTEKSGHHNIDCVLMNKILVPFQPDFSQK
jgi:hypothetical protein